MGSQDDYLAPLNWWSALIVTINSDWAAFVIPVYTAMALITACVFLWRNNFRFRDEATPHLRPLLCNRILHYIRWISPFLLVLCISKLTKINIPLPSVCAAALVIPVARLYRIILTDPRSILD